MGTKGIEQKTGYQPTPPPTHAAGLETGPTLRDPLAEALGLISLADARGLQVRLMGGLAFHALMPTWTARISRDGRDIDLATRSRDQRAVADLLAASGYAPDKQYNALYGHKQLYFADLRDGRPGGPPGGPALAETGAAGVNVPRILEHTSVDWGWWRTVTGNLDRLAAFVGSEMVPADLDTGTPAAYDAAAQIGELRARIDAAPKSTRWKLRARIGDRTRWYEEPEEVGHGR